MNMKVIKVERSKIYLFEDFYAIDCYSWAYEGYTNITIWI